MQRGPRTLNGENDTQVLAAAMAQAWRAPLLVYLSGELGVGKTTLVRHLLHAFGHQGSVRSPTYNLVEPYALDIGPVFHFDLYRVEDPEELELIGWRDYLAEAALCLVEWPERAQPLLPPADVEVFLQLHGHQRLATVRAEGGQGAAWMQRLAWPTAELAS